MADAKAAEELVEEVDEANEEVVKQAAESGRSLVECKATKEVNGEKREAVVYLDLGGSASEMIEMFNDGVVHDLAIRSAKIKAQSQIRSLLEAGKSQEEIAKEFVSFDPSASRRPTPKDPVQAILSGFGNLDPEKREEVLKSLRESMQG